MRSQMIFSQADRHLIKEETAEHFKCAWSGISRHA